jgi:glycosyltransferase involved in cell wall biosynthesis
MNTTKRLSSISIVFPAYNEAENIEAAVAAAREAATKYAERHEIIIVNDGSADRTGEIIDAMARDKGDVVPVHHSKNRGYGAALCSGFNRASMDYVFFSDSDLQFDLNELGKLVEWSDQYDIVAGYRAQRADSFHRKLNAWAWNMLVRLLLGVKARDIDCAFKLFKRRIFETIKLDSAGAMVNTEILALARRHNFTMKELPVSHYPRIRGQQTGANLRVIIRAFRELFKMYGRLKQQA